MYVQMNVFACQFKCKIKIKSSNNSVATIPHTK